MRPAQGGFYGSDLNVALTGTYQAEARTPDGKRMPIEYRDSQTGFDYRREFRNSLEFANKYAGYHADPAHAPGAWIALREDDAVADATNTRQKLQRFNTDFTYLMERLPDQSVGVTRIGPEHIRYGAYARRLPPQAALQLKINPQFRASLKGAGRLNVIYYDDLPGTVLIVAVAGKTWQAPTHGGKTWRTISFDLPAMAFPAGSNEADIRIQTTDQPVCFHLVEIERR